MTVSDITRMIAARDDLGQYLEGFLMRVFVTGASGWIGSAVTAELLSSGHQVVGLARSDASADAITAAGAEVVRGDLTDLDSLRAGAEGADGIIHTGYNHDFSNMELAATSDFAAVQLFGDLLEGSNRPIVIASGILGAVSVETDRPDPATSWSPRLLTEQTLLSFSDRGIRSSAVRLAPTVHGDGDHGFMATLVAIDRKNKTAGYVNTGTHWPAVHRLDAAHLFCLALEKAPAGTVLHAIDDEGVLLSDVAEVIGRHLDVPVVPVAPDDAEAQFGWLGRFLAIDSVAHSAITRELIGWEPTHPGLLEDLEAGHYFTV
jgi:nucleoside-diphosphate-sugar epimerase